MGFRSKEAASAYYREYKRQRKLSDPTGFNAESRANQQKARARGREFVARAKSRPCADCGVQYNPWVMDFDHRNPAEKKFTIAAQQARSLKSFASEIAKCDVVCSNCHGERTHRQQVAGLV